MPLTRPQRRLLLLPTFILLWMTALAALWLPSTTSRLSVGPQAAAGFVRTDLGLMTYLIVERQAPPDSGLLDAISTSTHLRWYWHHSNLFLTLFATAGATAFCHFGYRWRLNRRPFDGRCDECGYSLTGLRGHLCPECGSPISLKPQCLSGNNP